MWHVEAAPVDDATFHWNVIAVSGRTLSFTEACEAWRLDAGFRTFWTGQLKTVPFSSYCWECPPLSISDCDAAFECVFVSSPSLARMATDACPFSGHFRPGCEIATFWSLGGDALLVAPCPEETGNFAHLASFTATASVERQNALWQAVGEAVTSRIGPRPLWLSTAGHGVAWLHVRLDSRPKYYRHAPYMRS
jgi:hypothetical protein